MDNLDVKQICKELAELLNEAACEVTEPVRSSAAALKEQYWDARPVLPKIVIEALDVLTLLEADVPSPPLPSSARLRELAEKLQRLSDSC
ncbi:hypothetical protein COV18_02685 [Candidatus Woesearchaeota archaeon CG10_big_fil_rev_8_21_14_0_10_37_12]|nr:MAG: hypothetical protein COV18_02685 [Candidatus Woesearchaeota archaeon CG10_big_fil_rev_8_21_14_0_10_37_12]